MKKIENPAVLATPIRSIKGFAPARNRGIAMQVTLVDGRKMRVTFRPNHPVSIFMDEKL